MRINIYDSNLNRVASVGNLYVSCYWSEGYNSVGRFTLELQETEHYKSILRPEMFVGREDRNTLMVVKSLEVRDGKIVITGKQATRLLDDLAFVGTIPANSNISTAFESAYNKTSKYPILTVDGGNLDAVYSEEIQNTSMLDVAQSLCAETDVGIRAIRSGSGIVIQLYKPEINKNVKLSEKYGNISVKSFSGSTESHKNYGVVIGELLSGKRIRVDIDLTGGDQRREIIIEAPSQEEEESESNYLLRIKGHGLKELLYMGKLWKCAFAPNQNDFGKKYDLGDLVTVLLKDYNITMVSRIVNFTQTAQNNAVNTTVEVGEIIMSR